MTESSLLVPFSLFSKKTTNVGLPFARHRHPAAPLSRVHAFTESEVWLPKKVFATDRSWRKADVRKGALQYCHEQERARL
jgi:hypothetical protein